MDRREQEIKFRAVKNIYWDDCGHMRLVFEKGQVYTGVQYSDGNVTAETPFYPGIEDYIYKDEMEIIERF